ncbi:glycosyltransferase family 39 protein [Variovorax sp. J22R133]|uniref:glycosyltransferase family 39 protein n=1 Tax=Variovorax brevis TaxID=3053503 RepID=UPI00257667DB|nr:glycosyltransferase family 39 protein [Variovorax sp. J22R133]MDM0114055.1 glycosyltransferase family 39 protein [Variovorax sp. J22R133]
MSEQVSSASAPRSSTLTAEAPGPAARSIAQSVWLAGIFVLFSLVWFASLGARSLITPDEGRYSSLSLGMLQSGDWITPRLNGVLYFEKPALQYWLGALSFKLFGVTEFAARLWPGLAGYLTVLVVGYTAYRLWGREAGIRALAICASMTWIIGNSHFLTLDAGLAFFLTLALCGLLLSGTASGSVRRNWIWLAWAAMAGAVLSKGLVGLVIPGAALVLVSLWRRDVGLWRGMHWWSGGLIFLVLAAPWFVAVSLRNPGFADFFFIHEHFTRFLSTEHRREGAWWYFGPMLLAGMLPWTSALPWLFHRSGPEAPVAAGSITARQALIVWAGFVLVFFSMSGSKLPSYILPMFPPLALLLALRLRDVAPSTLRWHLLVPTLLWFVALVLSTQAHRFASGNTPVAVLGPLESALRSGAALFLAGAALAWWLLGRRRTTAAILSVAMTQFLACTLVMASHDSFGQLKSAAPFAKVLRPLLAADTPVFSVRDYDQTLPFYLGRNVALVDYEDEFKFGQSQEADRWMSLEEFVTRWRALPQAAAYMGRPLFTELDGRGLPMRVLFQDARRVVVMKR